MTAEGFAERLAACRVCSNVLLERPPNMVSLRATQREKPGSPSYLTAPPRSSSTTPRPSRRPPDVVAELSRFFHNSSSPPSSHAEAGTVTEEAQTRTEEASKPSLDNPSATRRTKSTGTKTCTARNDEPQLRRHRPTPTTAKHQRK